MTRRRPERAISAEADAALLLIEYLQRYDHDPTFCTELEELYASAVGWAPPLDREYQAWLKAVADGNESHVPSPFHDYPFPPGSGAYDRYRLAVDRFVNEWGLDRLEGASDGWSRVNQWCLERQRWPDSTSASDFSLCSSWVEATVQIDTAVTVEITGSWDPQREPRQRAQARLERLAARAIRERLEPIAAAAEAAGLRFYDTTPAGVRHLDWIFQLCTGRTTIFELAEALDVSEDAIARAVTRMARRLHVRTDGWYALGPPTRSNRHP